MTTTTHNVSLPGVGPVDVTVNEQGEVSPSCFCTVAAGPPRSPALLTFWQAPILLGSSAPSIPDSAARLVQKG